MNRTDAVAAHMITDSAHSLVASVVREAQADQLDLVTQLVDGVFEQERHFHGDETMRDELERAAHALTVASLELLRDPDKPIEVVQQVLPIVAAYVQRGHPLSILVQAYRVGQTIFFKAWLDRLTARASDTTTLSDAIRWTYDRFFLFMNTMLAASSDEYMRQEKAWRKRTDARRARLVRDILDGARPDSDVVHGILRHDLSCFQLALVICLSPEASFDVTDESMVEVARGLATEVGSPGVLTVSAGPTTVYAWISCRNIPDVTALGSKTKVPDDLILTVGSPARGVDGFCSSHLEAQAAHRVARMFESPPRITRYGEIAPIAMLKEDPAALARFVAYELGGLTARDQGTAIIRDTLRVALEESLNASRTAARIFVHKNTVLYRLRRAEDLRRRPISDDRLGLELALQIVERFGETLLDGVVSKPPSGLRR
ncbi:PucR family transcriptional regulator [Mycobacterium sp.]|uniref:PucR family transcriptional regulator n=1 Tax=Mycobacterium sp. TaxID=1785 RepID=UPI003D6C692D